MALLHARARPSSRGPCGQPTLKRVGGAACQAAGGSQSGACPCACEGLRLMDSTLVVAGSAHTDCSEKRNSPLASAWTDVLTSSVEACRLAGSMVLASPEAGAFVMYLNLGV